MNEKLVLRALWWRWWLTAVLWTLTLSITYAWFIKPSWPFASRWLLQAALALAVSLWIVARYLPQNHRPDETTLLPTFGPGNILTLIRGLFIGLLAGFLVSPAPEGTLIWLPALFYNIAGSVDYFDGYLARISHHVTGLGSRLDIEFDSLGMLISSLLAVGYGRVPWWYILLGLARYLFVWGIWWRQRRGWPVYPLPPSVYRRVFAGWQMGFLMIVLWPIAPAAGTNIVGTVIGLTTVLSFSRDWLVTIGRLQPDHPTYKQVQGQLYRLTTQWLPPFLRLLLLPILFIVCQNWTTWWPAPEWVAFLQAHYVPGADFMARAAIVLGGVGTLLLVLGMHSQLAALAVVYPVALDMATRGSTLANGLALVALTCIVLLGSGRFSLGAAQERRFVEPAGST